MSNFEFSKYCTPAQLYLVLGVIGLIGCFFKNYGMETLLTKALFLVIWAWVLNWLCSKGFKAVSWILVLLPFILVLFMFFFIKDIVLVKEGVDNYDANATQGRIKMEIDEMRKQMERQSKQMQEIRNKQIEERQSKQMQEIRKKQMDYAKSAVPTYNRW
jgi:competence protein ComGC